MKPYDPADRAAALRAVIRLERPLAEARAELAAFSFDWDGEPLGTVTREDIGAVLSRWSSGHLSAHDVEAWANTVECRDDVAFESEAISEAIYELANPTLHAANSLDEVAARFLN